MSVKTYVRMSMEKLENEIKETEKRLNELKSAMGIKEELKTPFELSILSYNKVKKVPSGPFAKFKKDAEDNMCIRKIEGSLVHSSIGVKLKKDLKREVVSYSYDVREARGALAAFDKHFRGERVINWNGSKEELANLAIREMFNGYKTMETVNKSKLENAIIELCTLFDKSYKLMVSKFKNGQTIELKEFEVKQNTLYNKVLFILKEDK